MKNKKTENIEKYADCMNDDDAIKITKKIAMTRTRIL